ncbi:MAG: hypothetical protein AABX13_05255 [Nanoarchaeota archaeon]
MISPSTLPKTEQAAEKAYQRCERNKKFRRVPSSSFSDYVVRSQKDLASA